MELYLKNIGKVAEAFVEIKGITVVAGENNTGKSTIGRALFSIFNSFYESEKQVRSERMLSIVNTIEIPYRNAYFLSSMQIGDIEEYAEEILNKAEEYKIDPELLKHDMCVMFDLQSDKTSVKKMDLDDVVKRVLENLSVSDDDIFESVLNKKIDSEFNGQLLNINSDEPGIISLKIKDEKLVVNVSENTVSVNEKKYSLHTEAIYIDDPFVLDDMDLRIFRRRPFYGDHRLHLENKLSFGEKNSSVVEEIVVENKFKKIYDKISSVCDGSIVRQKNSRLGYRLQNSNKTLGIKNLSTGLKTFAILKTLLNNGVIVNNGTIILDEPEIHLHPEWQLLFAELIVLLHKEFDMHILLNTHSPYFLRAIQVYSAKYKINDMCKYYLSEVKEGKAYIDDVTDNIDKIYRKLSRPLQQLEDERWDID